MPKKYQCVDTDPDSEDEQPQTVVEQKTDPNENVPLLKQTDEPSDDVKIPRKYKGKYNIEPEKVVTAIKEGKVQLTNKQVRKLIATEPKQKRVLSDEQKARLAEQLKRGRETIAKNKLLHGDTERQARLKRQEALIAEKAISVEKPPKGRPRNMKPVPVEKAPEPPKEEPPKEEKLPEPEPAPAKKFGRRYMVASSDTEDGDSTDTANIKRVRRKIKMVKEAVEPAAPLRSYANLSLVEKLLAKM